jgi:hypothetical protein
LTLLSLVVPSQTKAFVLTLMSDRGTAAQCARIRAAGLARWLP